MVHTCEYKSVPWNACKTFLPCSQVLLVVCVRWHWAPWWKLTWNWVAICPVPHDILARETQLSMSVASAGPVALQSWAWGQNSRFFHFESSASSDKLINITSSSSSQSWPSISTTNYSRSTLSAIQRSSDKTLGYTSAFNFLGLSTGGRPLVIYCIRICYIHHRMHMHAQQNHCTSAFVITHLAAWHCLSLQELVRVGCNPSRRCCTQHDIATSGTIHDWIHIPEQQQTTWQWCLAEQPNQWRSLFCWFRHYCWTCHSPWQSLSRWLGPAQSGIESHFMLKEKKQNKNKYIPTSISHFGVGW